MSRELSHAWVIASIVLFLAVEVSIGAFVGPHVVGKYVSPMFHLQMKMVLHLLSFYVGGFLVGLISPGVRLVEPAIGAAISVVIVFTMALFMPHRFLSFNLTKLALGGGIAFAVAMLGAYSGERLMGNLGEDGARAKLRARMWDERDGLLAKRR